MIGIIFAFIAGMQEDLNTMIIFLILAFISELVFSGLLAEKKTTKLKKEIKELKDENTNLFLEIRRKEKEIEELKNVITRMREKLNQFSEQRDENLAKAILRSGFKK